MGKCPVLGHYIILNVWVSGFLILGIYTFHIFLNWEVQTESELPRAPNLMGKETENTK